MMEPTFDSDGYPTEETLREIREWGFIDRAGFFEFIREAWSYPQYFKIEGEKVTMSTGGWSGNEEIISAMQDNRNHLWMHVWVSSKRGGHYEFEIKEPMK